MFLLEVMGSELHRYVDHAIPDIIIRQSNINCEPEYKNYLSREIFNLPGVNIIEQGINSDITPGRVLHRSSIFL